jgi:hypothetical protein
MKYLEQRVEELEKELALVRAKIKLEETKTTGFVNKQPMRVQKKDTSHYLRSNYPPSPDWRNKEINDYTFNSSVNLMSEPDLETAFASPWDSSEMKKNPLDTFTVNLSSIQVDNLLPNTDYVDSFDTPYYFPDYPTIIGSWDDCDWDTSKVLPYPNDDIKENVTDEYGFKMNHEELITTWGFVSKYDTMDKDFLKHMNSTEKRIENDFGKIVSKFKILTHEWEMDGYGYIVNDGTRNKIVITNHNKPMVANTDFLHSKIKQYKEIIQETERALFLVK